MISTTMHSSSKSHAIKGKSELKKVAKHNDRGYLSNSYDKDKIQSVIGDSATMESDTINFIDRQFEPTIKEYDEQQKRKDRKIGMLASDYFAAKKRTDLAVEQILQVADKDFWKKWRSDQTRTSQRTGKKYSTHTFDQSIIEPMNQLFREMALVIENLYGEENTRERILSKIFEAKEQAMAFVNSIPEVKRKRFDSILKLKKEEKQNAIHSLSKEDQETITEYNEAKAELKLIKDKQLIERTQNGQMHFKIINVTAHYDEWSPHAHMVGVAWADAYKNGPESQISKSVYLNKYALIVAQERIHELVEEKLKTLEYQKIFEGEELKPKEKGRNQDFTRSQIAAIKETEKVIKKNKHKINNQQEVITGLQKRAVKAKSKNDELKHAIDNLDVEIAKKRAESKGLDDLIRKQKEHNKRLIDKARQLIDQIKPLERIVRIITAVREFGLFDDFIYSHLRKRLAQIDFNELESADPEAIEGLFDLNDAIEEGFDIEEVENSIKTIQEMDEYDIH